MAPYDYLFKELNKIKVIVSDVDGVLTDGRIHLTEEGKEVKSFNAKDGSRVELALASGISVVLVTSRRSGATIQRAKELNVPLLFKRDLIGLGKGLFQVLKEMFRVDSSEVLYIGDDWSDLFLMRNAGLSATPFDGSEENKKVAQMLLKASSGDAVLSEVIEVVLRAQNKWEEGIERYKNKLMP